ncbi:HXXEE domain-containing protein [Mycobacterium palustre]|uniref:HXXEE domain-containing protein n=1 Tax=Mycobacterium palustre TaxID=153971 RepID=UPI00114FBF36|nr:HXXEE domain-containing protein [Mycobacterium palustre]MCV7102265.1 HXXEE domain-containing protein [Mycobacterium palustre]
MTTWSLKNYRENWPWVGAVAAKALAGASVLGGREKMTNLRALSVMNALALAVHQYEEYVDPRYFVGQASAGGMRSSQPRNYPSNRQSSLCTNTVLAYPFHLAPIVFPRIKWLGLPLLFGLAQAVDHGIVLPGLARARYSPGFLAAILLHVPIGLTYSRALRTDGPIARGTWRKSGGATLLFLRCLDGSVFRLPRQEQPLRLQRQTHGPLRHRDRSVRGRCAQRNESELITTNRYGHCWTLDGLESALYR